MFTGLVEMTGKISGRSSGALMIAPSKRLEEPVIGESIAVNGCCLTLEKVTPSGELVFHTMAESLRRTNLGSLPVGARVNMERALASGSRLGGHIVQGHVDAALRVVSLARQADGDLELAIELAPELAPEVPLPPKEFPRRHLLWLLLLIIPAGLWLVLKKRKKQAVPLSLRQRTLGALDSLRAGVFARRLTACEGIAGISDLLRNYLEERYALPASGKTTPEFLDEMEFHSALPARAGNFLRTFLNAADMIKFAQAPCDAAAVSTAVESAVELVKSTSDAEKEEQ